MPAPISDRHISMAVYRLIDQPVFPPPEMADSSGLLAVGGDLAPPRLLLAYSMGIFPWFNPDDPPLWWSPDPRCILEPSELRVSRSLFKTLRKGVYQVTYDRSFAEVITACAEVRRKEGEGTWITEELIEAFRTLHRLGFAHSVESWYEGQLVGGLYGVSIGRCFFGESMFHRRTDASKVAFVTVVRRLQQMGIELIDCQIPNPHLTSLGAREIPRGEFLERLRRGDVSPSARPPRGLFPSA